MVLGTPVLAITLLLVALERGLASASSIRSWAATRCCSSTCSGSTRTRPCTSWSCRHGRDQRDDRLLFAQAHLRLRFVAFSSLAIAVLGFLVWGHHMFVSGQSVYAGMVFSFLSYAGGDSLGDQGLQLDGDALQGLDHASTRRCCTRWASSACSRSAD